MTAVNVTRRLSGLMLLFGAGLLLSACGTVSKSECQVGDWRSIGLRDGREGRPELFFARNAESCQRYGLAADKTAWDAGRAEGLKEYCTPLSGYANGSAGNAYENVCTGRAGADFVTAYALGRDVREARETARELERDADRIDREIRGLESEILNAEASLSTAADADRSAIRQRISELRFRRLDLVSERFSVERRARDAAADAAVVEGRARATFVAAFGFPPA